jgi:predicted DsbA family dithiol-disulfide isomerase
MKVEIWSDIMCPFCYIGKRRFEAALDKLDGKERVQLVWRSYQLDPSLKPVPGQSIHQYLAARKGVDEEEGRRMNEYMTGMAAEIGLE